jgi:RNA polymerase sigma-70 factor (ECF subfamily)
VLPPAEPAQAALLGRALAEIAEGRVAALERVYDLVGRELYGLALWRSGSANVAADVVQDVLLALAHRPERLTGVRSPRSYLLAAAHRACIDRFRRDRRAAEHPLDEAGLLEAPPEEPGRAADARLASDLLRRLPDAQREAIYLHHFAGLSFSEVGSVTGVPTFTAASRYRLGIRRLRILMGVTP